MIIQKQCCGVMATNAYLLIDEVSGEGALIDCPCKSDVLDEMVQQPALKRLKYIILTHGHYDHIIGVAHMKEKTGASVLIHEADQGCLTSRKQSMAIFANCEQTPMQADAVMQDGDVLYLGDCPIKVLHTPGHTKGGCCFVIDDSIFTGDTLFYGTIGATHFPGGNESVLLNSLEKLDALEGDYQLYPGHEQNSTLNFERKNNPYFQQ